MIKKYCDICGKEVEEIEQEPKWLTDKFGIKIQFIGYKYKPKKYDVCSDCAAYLYGFMSWHLPVIRDENSDYEITICVDKKVKKD